MAAAAGTTGARRVTARGRLGSASLSPLLLLEFRRPSRRFRLTISNIILNSRLRRTTTSGRSSSSSRPMLPLSLSRTLFNVLHRLSTATRTATRVITIIIISITGPSRPLRRRIHRPSHLRATRSASAARRPIRSISTDWAKEAGRQLRPKCRTWGRASVRGCRREGVVMVSRARRGVVKSAPGAKVSSPRVEVSLLSRAAPSYQTDERDLGPLPRTRTQNST